jgi:hypothetical protein
MSTQIDYEARVAKGIALLDEKFPHGTALDARRISAHGEATSWKPPAWVTEAA